MTEEIIIDGIDVSGCEKLGETIDGITCGLGKRIRFANEIITKHKLCKDNPNCVYKQLKLKEQELQAQRNFTTQEQRKIYCVAYDKTCETGNECKQKKCVFKDRLKYKQALDEIEKIVIKANSISSLDSDEIRQIRSIINKVKEDN